MLERAEEEVARMIDRIVTPFAGRAERAVKQSEEMDKILAEAEEQARVLADEAVKICEKLRDRCGTCRHFIGGGDWYLCCDLRYDLCYEDYEACGLYEYSEEAVRRRVEQKKALEKYVAERVKRAKSARCNSSEKQNS